MDSKYIKIILIAVTSVILISSLIVPLLNSAGKIVDLDGTFGFIDNSKLWSTLDPFSAVIYTLGDFFCHQQMSRTMIVNGNEMPFCVRDLGIMAGVIIGLAVMLFLKDYDRNKMVIISVSGLVLMFIDWLIQNLFSLNVPETRFITGMFAGAAAAFLVMMILDGKLLSQNDNLL